MTKYDENFLKRLILKAKSSPRLRAHYSLHTDHSDSVQRLYIALCKGTYIPPHYHSAPSQWEFFQVIKGEIKVLIFDKEGKVDEVIHAGVGNDVFALNINPNTIHTVICKSELAVIFELKEGPFHQSMAKKVPIWSIPEDSAESKMAVKRLEQLKVGDVFNGAL